MKIKSFYKNLQLIATLVLLFVNLQAFSQFQLTQNKNNKEDNKQEEETYAKDPLGRRTPRGTASGFLEALAENNYSKAKFYFNTKSNIQNTDVIKKLENLLDYSGYLFPYSWISNDPKGNLEDNLPPKKEKVGSVTVDGDEIDIILEQIKAPDGGPIWVFSKETVSDLKKVDIDSLSTPLIQKIIPKKFNKWKLSGAPLIDWIIMLIIGGLAYIFSWGITYFVENILPKIWKKTGEEPFSIIIHALGLPVRLTISIWLWGYTAQLIGISILIRQKFSWISIIIGVIAILILFWRLTIFLSSYTERKLYSKGNISGVSVVLFLKRATKIAIVVIGIIIVLGVFGIDVTAGIAALGLGGIAIALGAQKTVENFVGSVTLIADQPIRVGDFCKVGDVLGTIEKIGMRSTRIRTLNRTIVTIPNGNFSSAEIENYTHRDQFWFHHTFGLRYETTPDQIRYLLVELRNILYAHPLVSENPARVRFLELDSHSINLEIFAYITVQNYDEYLEVQEDLLLRMMDVVEESGSGFAFPSQTLYLSRDEGVSEEKSEKAAQAVKKWKENNDLQIPQFDHKHIDDLKGSIPYPPEGSVQNKKTDD
ncbi:mechanosensitive ion channel family protein [Zunongwangia sp.]|uniref:mechanosensitive ion channel family protein n=1 Tax=Zunongwangia sp. TaxID=1965325 RepID=UPI003AA833F4